MIASGLLMHAKEMGTGTLSIVAFGIALWCPKHGGCASGRQKVELFCVSIELGERLLFKEEERGMMSNLVECCDCYPSRISHIKEVGDCGWLDVGV